MENGKNMNLGAGLSVLSGLVLLGGVGYFAYKAGARNAMKAVANEHATLTDAIVIARDTLAQNPDISKDLFYTVGEKKDLLADILKGLSNKAGIWLERLGDVIPEGAKNLQEVPGHIVNFTGGV